MASYELNVPPPPKESFDDFIKRLDQTLPGSWTVVVMSKEELNRYGVAYYFWNMETQQSQWTRPT